ncbi:MAG: winged-helix domain-containing protein [Actinomycetota bacterium]|nr:winged-helix domain-containing protein [Actinomycetota bacterium]
MALLVLLSDRAAEEALPALSASEGEVKVEHLSVTSIGIALEVAPEVILVDGAENPGQAHAVLRALAARSSGVPLLAIVERGDLDRLPWAEVADEVMHPGAPSAEIAVRLGILRRRSSPPAEGAIRLGPLTLDAGTFQVTLSGRALDLTFKEFELLQFLASRPGRVFTRPALLREVWGYDFYGGTRTVDVHVRRLRAKLGPEHERLIETVRGVGYRAAEPEDERDALR